MNVILLSPGGSFASALDSLKIREVGDRAMGITASTSDSSDSLEIVRLGVRALPSRGPLSAFLERSVIGRNVKRITPLDGGRRFAAATRRNPQFRRAVQEADLIVALERDAVLAAWTALHRWARADARGVYGLAPARALLTSQRASGDAE